MGSQAVTFGGPGGGVCDAYYSEVLALADSHVVVREVSVVNPEGFHARPVMMFVDKASSFDAKIMVTNTSRGDEALDGKSAMQLMLLDAPKGSRIRVQADGKDALEAADALSALIAGGFSLGAK